MSIALMTVVFQRVDLPPNQKIVLLRMADAADDDGRGVYLSVGRIAHESGISKRTVQNVLREFEREGIVAIDANYVGGRGKSRVYRIDIDRAQELHPLPGWVRAKEAPDGGSPGVEKDADPALFSTEKGADRDAKGCKSSAPKPLEEPNQQTTAPPPPYGGSPPTGRGPPELPLGGQPSDQKGSNPGKAKSDGTKRGTRIDPDWRPTARHFALGRELRFGKERVEFEAGKFVDHWCAKAGREARKLDWDRAFNNWLRNAREFDQRDSRGARNHDAGRSRHEPPSVVAAVRQILGQA